MIFGTFLLRVDGAREATLDDLSKVVKLGQETYPKGKYLYHIHSEIVENRFFWMSCDYDDAQRFRNYVVDSATMATENNPRTKNQVELRYQLFVCYDVDKHFLYLNDMHKHRFVEEYMSFSTQMEFKINNVYASVDDFCNHIKYLRRFKYVQVDNLFAKSGDVFQNVADMWGRDAPDKIQLEIGYGDIPINKGRPIISRLFRKREQFESVIVVGCDDEGMEQTFDFSSVIKRIEISPVKDQDEYYDPIEVRTLLLEKLR